MFRDLWFHGFSAIVFIWIISIFLGLFVLANLSELFGVGIASDNRRVTHTYLRVAFKDMLVFLLMVCCFYELNGLRYSILLQAFNVVVYPHNDCSILFLSSNLCVLRVFAGNYMLCCCSHAVIALSTDKLLESIVLCVRVTMMYGTLFNYI